MKNIANLDRKTLIDEIEINLWEMWSHWGMGPGCSLHDDADALWFETPIPLMPFNGVFKFKAKNDAKAKIESIINQFKTREVPFIWVVHPTSAPDDLYEQLINHGLKDVEPIFGMAKKLTELSEIPALPDGIEIRKARDEHDVIAFNQFAAWRWSVPDEYKDRHIKLLSQFRLGKQGTHTHVWQAWKDDQPIAKVGMYLGSGSAGIHAVATKPDARGLGLAKALTLTALNEAQSVGYKLAVLHSTPMAQPLYKKLGFESIADFSLFASEDVYI